MTGCNPPRKGRSWAGAGGDGLEEAWLVAEAPAKKPHARAAAWGVTVSFGLRGHFNSFVLLLLVLFVVLVISVTTTKNDSSGGGGPEQRVTTRTTAPPPADDASAGGQGECDMSSGRWVYDDAAYPLYEESACKFMSDQSACGKFGRTDLKYQHWRWQPHGCDLPRCVLHACVGAHLFRGQLAVADECCPAGGPLCRFDVVKLLQRLRGKRLAFVGDSLNRNQWISMVCLIDTATPMLRKSMAGGNSSLVSFKIHVRTADPPCLSFNMHVCHAT